MPAANWLGPLISGLFGFGAAALEKDPQERRSFAGTAGTDPKQLLAEYTKNLTGLAGAATNKLSKGTQLRGYAPPVAGVNVKDPAAIDPSLLKYDGLDLSSIIGPLFGQKPQTAQPSPLTPDQRRDRRTRRENFPDEIR